MKATLYSEFALQAYLCVTICVSTPHLHDQLKKIVLLCDVTPDFAILGDIQSKNTIVK